MLLTRLTWNLGCELGDDRRAVALGCASTKGEGVRGARVEACEHVGGLVAQLHYFPTLVGEVQLRVKGAHRLVGDLGRKEMNILIVVSGTPCLALFSWGGICIHTMKTFHAGGISELKHLLYSLRLGLVSHSWSFELSLFPVFFLSALISKAKMPRFWYW